MAAAGSRSPSLWRLVELADDDIRELFEASALFASDPLPSFEVVLELIRSLIPCSSVSFNDMTLATGDFRYIIVPADQMSLAARLKPVYDRFAHQHPLIMSAQMKPVSGALRFCDVAGPPVTESDLYREFYEPFGIRYQLVIQLPSPPDVVVGYACNRSATQGEFSDRDVAVLNAIGAHLCMHHRRAVDVERADAMALEVDRGGGWTILTARSDGVVESSSGTSPPPLVRSGRITPEIIGLLPTGEDTRCGAATHDVMVDDERWRCVVHPVPVGPTVLLVRRLGEEPVEVSTLHDLGLTPRQADVAIELGRSGGTNAQLARTLGITEGTVKKHLETVFRALGVDSRAAAVVVLRSVLR